MALFTDRELGMVPPTKNEIKTNVWNGIFGIIESSIANNYFAKDFPESCPDGLGIYGVNLILFQDKIHAIIPQIDIPLTRKEPRKTDYDFAANSFQIDDSENTYAILDLIEFCYQHIVDSEQSGRIHEHFNHYHLKFSETTSNKSQFRNAINQIFERNGIAYLLSEDGCIKRVIPQEFQQAINRSVATSDDNLNGLINEAKQNILRPNPVDRSRGLEKIWDAFERVKTFYGAKKKASADQLLSLVASGNGLFEDYLKSESATLTEIGNKFQIRHFEVDKQPITDVMQIDYLFFRMFALIDLFVKKLEE